MTVSKTYTLREPDGRGCNAAEYSSVLNAEGDDTVEITVPCDGTVVLCIDLVTITYKGKRIPSKVGFCKAHSPRKYMRWFGLAK